MKRTLVCLIALIVAVSAVPVFAATQTANLNVTASVATVCTITTSPVAFGPYDPVTANATTDLLGAGSVNVACTKGAATTIDLGNGSNFAGGTRRMSSGTDFLNYALYQDNTRTVVWGTGLAGGTTAPYLSTSPSVTLVPVYGTVPQAQNVSAGSYADVVVATINY